MIVPDAPPLGKYLIGISTLIFNNPNIIIVIFGIAGLFMLYVVGRQILKNNLLALLPPVLFSFEPLFKNQFAFTPALDLFQLFFLLTYFYFINKAFFNKKNVYLFFALAHLFLGFFISTKFFVSGIPIVLASILFVLLAKKKDRILPLLVTLPIALFVLLATYARVFAFGYNIHQFLGIQKWVFLYHKSQIIFPFSAWDLLLFNRWHVWFGDKPVISDAQWFISWPILTCLVIMTAVLYLLKKIERAKGIEILLLWAGLYLAMLSLGQIFSRYFIILLPVFYLCATYGIVALIKQDNTKIHKKKKK